MATIRKHLTKIHLEVLRHLVHAYLDTHYHTIPTTTALTPRTYQVIQTDSLVSQLYTRIECRDSEVPRIMHDSHPVTMILEFYGKICPKFSTYTHKYTVHASLKCNTKITQPNRCDGHCHGMNTRDLCEVWKWLVPLQRGPHYNTEWAMKPKHCVIMTLLCIRYEHDNSAVITVNKLYNQSTETPLPISTAFKQQWTRGMIW